MNNNNFIKSFRTWLDQQKKENIEEMIGAEVFPNITVKKFCEVADIVKGNPISTGKCFHLEGGIIEAIIDNQALINCRKGKFYIDTRDIKKS